jgi:two-component system, OmpR family, sensor histidine kinase VicK
LTTTTQASQSDASNQKTEVLHGEQNAVNMVLQFTFKAKSTIDACVDYTRPSLAVEIEQLKKAFLDAKKRGVKLRYVTEITKDNVQYSKELLNMVDELRHIDGIKGNFYISETEYIAPATFHEKGKPASRIIYSNVSDIVEYQRQFVFDSFWSRAVPAEHKIKEIEEGITHYETKVLENKEQIFSHMKSVIGSASNRSVVSSIGGMQLVYNNFFEEYKKILDRQRAGKTKGKGLRWITYIDGYSVELAKIFLNAGIQVRHIKNLTPMNFAVDDRYFYATIDKMENGNLMQSLLTSNEPAYIRHYNSIFEELWKNGVDAAQRIKDIEAGVHLADIEVIPSSARAQQLYLDIVKSASDEILWIFPTSNALIRQEKIGAIHLARKAARERNVKVRILVPTNTIIEQKIQQLKEHCCSSCPSSSNDTMIDARYIAQMSETKATILVIDRKASLVMELKDDSKTTFIEAIGLSTYSNSKAGVSSYVAIFENLWKQTELYDQLKQAHEQLKTHDKMQEEFINIAAHELRTPIQPILGLTQVLRYNIKDQKQCELLDVTIRNAKRLQRLTEDILNVTKIESQSLNLNKERFNLKDVISNAIDDITTNMQSSSTTITNNNNGAINLVYHQPQDVFIYADKGRISQVVFNLLDNAVKFTKDGGIITVVVEETDGRDDDNKQRQQQIVLSVKDQGTGIDSQIFPRLFTKFATKSQTRGTGLGLFICKGIIEAHGGNIRAENNEGKGATFSFSLPLVNNSNNK